MKRKDCEKEQQRKALRQKLRPIPARKEIAIDELRAIVERAASVLPPADVETLTATVDTLMALTQELETKGTSILRLRHLLFGPRTESKIRLFPDTGRSRGKDETPEAKDGSDQSAEDEGSPGDEGSPEDEKTKADKPKRKGHGRVGSDQYKGAKQVEVQHESLTPKSSCPCCEKGKVYRQKDPATLVRITGMAPLSAIVYEKERLRCNACGEVFTATKRASRSCPTTTGSCSTRSSAGPRWRRSRPGFASSSPTTSSSQTLRLAAPCNTSSTTGRS